jgi:hypothetical protein
MYIGSVGSVPDRKKAMMNSSKETVKVRRKLATTPGKTMGKVTRQKVDQGGSPRSAEASSIDRSKPSNRGRSVATENGRQTIRWPSVTV